MGLFSQIKSFLLSANKNNDEFINIQVRCNKCDEELNSFFKKNYDLQSNLGESSWAYLINKKLLCPGCYQTISLRVELDRGFKQINSEIIGGEFINK